MLSDEENGNRKNTKKKSDDSKTIDLFVNNQLERKIEFCPNCKSFPCACSDNI